MNDFYDGLTDAINKTFTGTVFAAPALDVVYCLIGTKVEGLSTALTWLHDNAHLTLPQVKENIFALSDDASNELVSSLDDGPDGTSDSASSSVVRTLVDQYRRALEKERQVFYFMLGLYGLVVLFAVIAILWTELVAPQIRRKHDSEDQQQNDFPYNEKSGFEPSIKAEKGFMAAAGAKGRQWISRYSRSAAGASTGGTGCGGTESRELQIPCEAVRESTGVKGVANSQSQRLDCQPAHQLQPTSKHPDETAHDGSGSSCRT